MAMLNLASETAFAIASSTIQTPLLRFTHVPAKQKLKANPRHGIPAHASLQPETDRIPSEHFDVSSNCVQPFFRSVPIQKAKDSSDGKFKILFLSESNICRSVYAEAAFTSIIKEKKLEHLLECSSKGTRDYNQGEQPTERVLEVAEDFGLEINNHVARVFDCANDVVEYDLILVMDKFTASDALKEVTIYEAIDKSKNYSWKVRRLGDFCSERKIEDIDDPLYGNIGGAEEQEELYHAALDIRDSCQGLVNFLEEVHLNREDSEDFRASVARSMGVMAPVDWLIPPMLQRS